MKRSLVFRTGLALVGVSVTVVLSMFLTMLVAETLQGDAAAINLSGSLRMQTYRVINSRDSGATEAEVEQQIDIMETKLANPLLDHVMHTSSSPEFAKTISQLREQWSNRVRPAIMDPSINPKALTQIGDNYVESIEDLVSNLQRSSEAKIEKLRAIQGFAMFLVVTISFILLYRVHINMVQPLKDLVGAAQRIQGGDFTARSEYTEDDELGLLSHTFNQMAKDLSALYRSLEQQVEQKTKELQRSNASLRLLYESSRKLYSNPSNAHQRIQAVLHKLQATAQLETISLCLSQSHNLPAYQIITSDDSGQPPYCQLPNCDDCRANVIDTKPNTEVVKFPVLTGETQLGDISVQIEQQKKLSDWQRNLLSAMADIIGSTLGLSQLSDKEARLALMEERSVIARELHDSLAQTLSYQKLQASRLKKLLERQAETHTIEDAIQQVQEGLNVAYRQLRELLATFRLQIDGPGLQPSLLGTVTELKNHTETEIHLDNQLEHCPLTPNEEVHCVQIVREALANVIKHAHAQQCWVTLHQDTDGEAHIRIVDDGIGIPDSPTKHNHYGLVILAERTRSLGGTLKIGKRAEGGTEVHAHFMPMYRNRKHQHSIEVTNIV